MGVLLTTSLKTVRWENCTFPCALGEKGISSHKLEGDQKTPVGNFRLLRVYYRPDRLVAPKTSLPVFPLQPSYAWCDDTTHPLYNKFVMLPFHDSHENMWRDDNRYNIIVTTNHNQNPTQPGLGSAIFIHVAEENPPGQMVLTQGCLALFQKDLLEILESADANTVWSVPHSF